MEMEMVATMWKKVNLNPLAKKTSLPHVPNNCSPNNILEVSSLVSSSSHALDSPTSYHLPFKHNRGKPLVRYSPNVEEKESKYLIVNHVTT